MEGGGRRAAGAEAQRRAGRGEADAPAAAPGRDGRLPGLQLMAPTLLLALLLALLGLLGTGHPLGKAPSRPRRGILQLAGMIQCTTGRTPLAYIRYGCYCGLGGFGWPKDQVDWCCFKHDCCYGKAEEENCAPKTRRYPWECKDSKAKCDDIEDKCQKMACECDRDAAKCLAKAPYNVTLLFWPDTWCAEKGPTCPDD